MARNIISGIWDSNNLGGMNANFAELYEKVAGAKNAYELWLEQPGNSGKSLGEFLEFLSAKQDNIAPDNTTFIVPDKNLFNKNDLEKGGYYTELGFWVANTGFNMSGLIPVKPSKQYTFSSATITGHLSFWDIDGKFVSGIKGGTYGTSFTVPSGSNIRYVRFPMTTSEDINKLMLVEGTTVPSTYQPYKLALSKEITLNDEQLSKYLTTDKIDTTGSKNLFNYTAMITTGSEISTNSLVRAAATSALLYLLPIDSSRQKLTISNLPTYADGYNRLYSFYDGNKNPVKATLAGTDSIARNLTGATIDIPINASYFSINLHSNKTSSETLDYSRTQIEYGGTATPFSPYASVVSGINGMKISNGITPLTASKGLLVFGDSITETATLSDDGTSYQEGTRSNWLTWLRADLPFKTIWNHAKAGASYKDRSDVLPQQQISHQINTAITRKRPADIIVIAMGTNDGNTNLGDYNTAMAKKTLADLDRTQLYEALRWAFWTIQSQPDWEKALKFVSLPIQRADYEPIQSLHKAISEMAKRYGFIVIDMTNESQIIRDYEVWGAKGRDLSDGLHPHAQGQQKMSEVFGRHISNALIQKQ